MSEHLYYRAPEMREFEARVEAWADGPARVALDRSAFYPESGGQPGDRGWLRGPDGSRAEVVDVQEDDAGRIWHQLASRPGWPVGSAVAGGIEWGRRRDHMQQHSGQHLLSAVVARRLGAATLSFHLGAVASTVDLDAAAIGGEELAGIERTVNEVIAEDRPITVRFVPRAEAEALLAAGELRKLPPRGGELRLIEIAGWDLNACGGTHCASTGAIGGLLLRGVERVRGGTRLAFVCGLRAAAAARADFDTLARLSAALSVPPAGLAEAVRRLEAESKAGAKQIRRLEDELGAVEAAALAAAAEPCGTARYIARRTERDAGYAQRLAARATTGAADLVVLLGAAAGERCRLALARGAAAGLNAGAVLRQALAEVGGRGGGSAEQAQGECAAGDWERVSAAVRAVVAAVA